jgi:hypothetical protein
MKRKPSLRQFLRRTWCALAGHRWGRVNDAPWWVGPVRLYECERCRTWEIQA